MTGPRRELALVLPFYLALILLFTWPTVTGLTSHVPGPLGGVEALRGLYTLTWGIHALAHQALHYFDANTLYPHAASLAYGDHLFGLAIAMAPIQWTLFNPTLTFNLAILASFLLAAAGAYLLARHITEAVRPSLVAGILYAFSAYRFAEIERLDTLSLAGLPWIFLIGHLYLESPHRRLIYLGAFFTLAQGVSSTRSLILLVLAAILAFGYSLYRQRRRHRVVFWRHRVHFLAATALFLLGVAPFLKPYLNHYVEEGGWRQPAVAEAVPVDMPLHLSSLFPPESVLGGVLSPGVVALLLIALLALGVFRNRDGDGHRVYFYAFLGGLALLLEVLMPLPFAALISLSAAVLAAVSLERMEVLLRGFRFGNLFAAVVVVLLLLELHPGPLPVVTSVPREGPPTEYLWLGATDPEAVIVELPAGGEEGMTEVLARRQLYSMYHWRRTVDGAAPRVPALTRSIRGRFRSFPDEASMAQIRALHVDYVLVHTDEYEAAERGRVLGGVMTRKDLVLERTFGETAVYRVE